FIKSIADASTEGSVVRLPPVPFQPVAAEDVAKAVARVAVGPPVNAVVGGAGPGGIPLDDAIRRAPAGLGGPRTGVSDPSATFYGMAVRDGWLVPRSGASLGEIRLDDWIGQSTAAATVVT